MIRRVLEIGDMTPKELALEIAHWDSEKQAAFFDRLALEFEEFDGGLQMCYIQDHITARAKAFIVKLSTYLT